LIARADSRPAAKSGLGWAHHLSDRVKSQYCGSSTSSGKPMSRLR